MCKHCMWPCPSMRTMRARQIILPLQMMWPKAECGKLWAITKQQYALKKANIFRLLKYSALIACTNRTMRHSHVHLRQCPYRWVFRSMSEHCDTGNVQSIACKYLTWVNFQRSELIYLQKANAIGNTFLRACIRDVASASRQEKKTALYGERCMPFKKVLQGREPHSVCRL